MTENNITDMREFIELCRPAVRDTLEEYKLAVGNVVTMSLKRDMIKVAGNIERICCNEDFGLSEVNKKINEGIDDVTEKYLMSEEVQTFGEKIDDIWQETKDGWNESGIAGFPTTLPELNKYATHEPSELMLVAGRMKTGKSAFMMNEAINMVKNGVPVLYIDTEMSDKQFFQRMLASLTGIRVSDIRGGNLDNEQIEKLNRCIEWIKSKPLVHEYMIEPQEDQIYALCRILKTKIDLGFVVYDYIKSDKDTTAENYNILGRVTNFLKNKIAGDLYIPVLAGAQLNRDNVIADSDKINRYVSTSLIWRPKTNEEMGRDGEDCGNYAMIVDVNRNGDQMGKDEYIDVAFDGPVMKIAQAKKQHIPPNPFGN